MKEQGQWISDAPLKKIFPKSLINWTQKKIHDAFSTKVGGQLNKLQLDRMPIQNIGLTGGEIRGYRYPNITEQQRVQYALNMLDAITNNNQQINFLNDLSIPHQLTVTYGLFGIPEYNFQLQIYGSKEEANLTAKVLGDALLQDSTLTITYDGQSEFFNAATVSKAEGSIWTESELNSLNSKLSPFTYDSESKTPQAGLSVSTDGKRLILIDPNSLVLNKDYTNDLYKEFVTKINAIVKDYGDGYTVGAIKTDSTLNEYKKEDYRGGIERLGHRSIALGRSNLQRTALNTLYLPAWEAHTEFGEKEGVVTKNSTPPWEETDSSLGKLTVDSKRAIEVNNKSKELREDTPRTVVPFLGKDASTLALDTFFKLTENNREPDPISPEIYERASRSSKAPVSPEIQQRIDEVAPNHTPNESLEFQMYADTDAYSATLMADRARGIFAAAMKYGAPVYADGHTKVEHIYVTAEEAKEFGLKEGTQIAGLIKIFEPLYNRKGGNLEDIFKYYAMAKRGIRLSEKLDKDGNFIEVPTTQEDVKNLEELENQFEELKKVYQEYQIWNNRLIDFATEAGILNKTTAEQWKKHADYYPFYRQFEGNDTMQGPRIFNGLVGANMGKELEGSKDPINVPMLDAILKNSLAITTASMKNIAAQRVLRDSIALGYAKPVPQNAKGPTIVRIKVKGNDASYHVEDPLLFRAMQAFGESEMGGIINVLSMPSTVLREAVTRDPGFILVNLMRDTLSAYVTSGAKFTPVIDTVKGFAEPLEALEMLGVVGGYDFANDPKDIVKWLKQIYNKQGIDIEGGNRGPVMFWKLWDGLGTLTTRSDAATRAAVYHAVLNETGNEAEAQFQALEIINFGRRGGNILMRAVTATIPFMNARIQGLDVLYRAGTGQYSTRRTDLTKAPDEVLTKGTINFLLRGGYLALITAIYYALVGDEEEYKNVRQEVRDDNWIIPITSKFAFKLPIPFEVGAIFKVIPERLIHTLYGDGDTNSLLNSFSRQFWVTFNLNPLDVQAVSPLMHAINNKNSFTGNDIVPYYLETGVEPRYQTNEGTNELAKQIGNALNISPLKIEYVMRGYGGTLGAYMLNITDYVLRGVTGKDYIPKRIENGLVDAVAGQLAGRFTFDPSRAGGLQQEFYGLRTETRMAVQTFNKLKKEGRMDEASAYFRGRPNLFKSRNAVNKIDQFLEKFRNKRNAIQISKTLSPERKKQLINDLEIERDRYLMIVPHLKDKAEIPTRWIDIITPPTI